MNYLTTNQKERMFPQLVMRDGPTCFYCKKPFEIMDKDLKRTFDHLDNNRQHNELSNLVLAHWKCNQLKRTYTEYIVMAKEKISENTDCLEECVYIKPPHGETSKEIDLNVAMKKLAWEYINERLVGDGIRPPREQALEFNDSASSISFLFWQRTGHGSSATVKRYLNDFCSTSGPFQTVDVDGVTLIKRRIGN